MVIGRKSGQQRGARWGAGSRRAMIAGLLVASGLWAAPAAADGWLPQSKPEREGMSSARLARIEPMLEGYIERQEVAGAVVAIVRNGKLVYRAARGSMDVAADKPMRSDAIFRIASMTKPITSVALMQLWERGLFQLQDPVAKFLPAFANVQVEQSEAAGATVLVAPERAITIRDLLTHTAGLGNNYRGNVERYRSVMRVRPTDDNASFIARLAGLPLNYHPGTQWQYSAATDVVGHLVEVISGQPLDAYFAEHIFAPLGMTDTAFYLDDDRSGRLAAQYRPDANGRIELQDPGDASSRWIAGPKRLFRGAGGLVSTASDYLRFQQMMLQGGELRGARILAPATVSLMLENHTGELPLWLPGPGMGFGLGYGVVVDRGAAATPLSLGSAYWGGAYCTLSWIDPAQQLVAVLMTQVRPYTHINIRQDFQVLAYQAILASP